MEQEIRKEIVKLLCMGKTDLAVEIIQLTHPDFLYKYRSGKERDIDALKNNKLWLGRATLMDDKEDGRLYVSNDIKKALRYAAAREPKFKNPKYKKAIENIADNTERQVFICSFSELCDNEDMWDRYASNKTGFCIEYKFVDLFVKANEYPLICLPISYEEKKPLRLEECGSKQNMIFTTLYKKCIIGVNEEDWKGQEEWRWSCFEGSLGKLDKPEGKLVSAPTPTKIIVGENSSEKLKRDIAEWINDNKATIELEFR